MKISTKPFGKTKADEKVTLYSITNNNNMTVEFINYGANIVSIIVPDSKGNKSDVVLGYNDIKGYEDNDLWLGAFVGRNCNRIAKGEFNLNNIIYKLEKNDGPNNLHSGNIGYSNYIYDAEIIEDEDSVSIEFSRLSPDMEQGFPGNLDITVTYSLTNDNELIIEYFAVSDKDTIVNLTNHSYFNLSGHNSGTIENHKVWINANSFTPTDDNLIPTGEMRDVSNTPMDFRVLKRIGDDIDNDYGPLKQAGGYDHNYVLNIKGDEIEKVAELVDDNSGRVMEVFTNKPGLQFYAGNFIKPVKYTKDNIVYNKREGVCFETQHYPNACNIVDFPSSILKSGEKYDYVTIYKFS